MHQNLSRIEEASESNYNDAGCVVGAPGLDLALLVQNQRFAQKEALHLAGFISCHVFTLKREHMTRD